jgi:hypothetical protein
VSHPHVYGVRRSRRFWGLATAILRHIENPTLAALALIGTGIALFAAIVLATQIKPWRSTSRSGGGCRGRKEHRDTSSAPGRT